MPQSPYYALLGTDLLIECTYYISVYDTNADYHFTWTNSTGGLVYVLSENPFCDRNTVSDIYLLYSNLITVYL